MIADKRVECKPVTFRMQIYNQAKQEVAVCGFSDNSTFLLRTEHRLHWLYISVTFLGPSVLIDKQKL